MKKIKGLRSLLFVLLTTAIMIATAFADEGYTITLTGDTAKGDYSVYQLYSSTISGEKYAYDINSAYSAAIYSVTNTLTKEASLKYIEALKDTAVSKFAADVYAKISNTEATTTVEDSTTIKVPSTGYYLIVDTTNRQGTEAANSTYMLVNVTDDVSVAVKTSIPTVEKKVLENVKTVSGNTDTRINDFIIPNQYNDVADYNIGDEVSFLLVGTLPSNYDSYTKYSYVFHDALGTNSDGKAEFAFVNSSVKVTLNTVDGTDITSLFKVTYDNNILTIATKEATGLKGNANITSDSKIVVTYKATLTADATVGLDGNVNEVYLEYSNNPNSTGNGSSTDSEDDDDTTGKTTVDKVIVFTYGIEVTKVDKDDQTNKLEGAVFTLYKLNGSTNTYATVSEDGKLTGWTTEESNASKLTTDKDGKITVVGLDDGTYFLSEVTAPTGYNKLDSDVEVKVTATTSNNQTWTTYEADEALTALSSGSTSTGLVSLTIKNASGSLLPTTGGIGTTILYVIGAILVICAGVALITKKRVKDIE